MPRTKPTYPDNIFGGLEKPSSGLKYSLKCNQGVRHYDTVRLQSNGNGGLELNLTVFSDSKMPVLSVEVVWSADDWQSRTTAKLERKKQQWQTIGWKWRVDWSLTIPVQEGQVIRYYVYACLADGSLVYAENQSQTESEATQFAQWIKKEHLPPAWSKDARIYQVFVDRFSPGEGKAWLQKADLSKPFGGTLRGVTEKLHYIQNLGFNTIWLSPIFSSPSHHGYDSSDYFEIEPRIGTLEDFKQLVNEVKARGMRLILDFVANHCSDQHPCFISSRNNQDDSHQSWIKWIKWPQKYDSFYNVPSMPKFNLRYGSPARKYLFEVAQYWLKLGVDGYRLDYANGPDRDFWVDFQRACLEINPECWTFGEVVAPVDEQAHYAGSMNGTLDFLSCQILREVFALRTHSAGELTAYLVSVRNGFPSGFSQPTFIDNHDMNRFFFAAEENLESLHAALKLLYLLPEAPIVYQGTELPLSQKKSIHDKEAIGFDEARLPMTWQQPLNTPTAALLGQLASFREKNAWLTEASWSLISTSRQGDFAELRLAAGDHELRVKILVNDHECDITWG